MAQQTSKYGLLGRLNFEDLYSAFLALEQRQQVFALAGAGVLLVILTVLPISCATSRLSGLEDDYQKGKKGRDELMEKISEYQSSRALLSELKQKMQGAQGGGSLQTIVASLAKEAGVEVERLKPVELGSTDFFDEEGVDVAIENASLEGITQFLVALKGYDKAPLSIKKIQLKTRYGKREELTASLQVSTLKLKPEGEL